MKTYEAVRQLVGMLDDDQPKQRAILWDAFVKMFDLMVEEYEEIKPNPTATQSMGDKVTAEKAKPAPKKRVKFDVGKMNALLKAGWSVPKIADEMRVSAPTVRKYMREEGYKF